MKISLYGEKNPPFFSPIHRSLSLSLRSSLPARSYTSPCAHRRPGTYRSYVLMMSLWRDNKCGEAAGPRSAAPGQQEYWSAHFRSHLCSETSPGRRLLRADRDAPKGRGRVVGGLRGWTTASHTCPVLHQHAKIKHTFVAWLIPNKTCTGCMSFVATTKSIRHSVAPYWRSQKCDYHIITVLQVCAHVTVIIRLWWDRSVFERGPAR